MEEIITLVRLAVRQDIKRYKIVDYYDLDELDFRHLSEQLTADILLGGLNDIPEELYPICASLV